MVKSSNGVYEGSRAATGDFIETALLFYFGSRGSSNPYRRYLSRAYRDLSRTIRGLDKVETGNRQALRDRCVETLTRALEELRNGSVPVTRAAFDEWHRLTCDELMSAYKECGVGFSVGQAQKWLNMTLKYVYVANALGREPFGRGGAYYSLAHVPIDGKVLESLKDQAPEIPLPSCPWSRLSDYGEYARLQDAVRSKYGCGLDADLLLWGGSSLSVPDVSSRGA